MLSVRTSFLTCLIDDDDLEGDEPHSKPSGTPNFRIPLNT